MFVRTANRTARRGTPLPHTGTNGSGAEALRGGSWNNNPQNVRASNRNRNEPANRNNNIGFRCVGDAGLRA